MLIRSQNKAVLLNFSNWAAIYIVKDGDDFIISSLEGENKCTLGKYSTKEKAMQVLDMIQEAYEEYKITCTFLTGFTGHRAIVESNNIHVDGSEELAKSFKKNMVFQMPEDGNVKV
jgi:hypothetical protein|nr:MAG TPA: hypothetical protein [Caudoviricetes sp.]